jgi:acyl-homoserine-lactone acylase
MRLATPARGIVAATAIAAAALAAGCATPGGLAPRTAMIERTTHAVPHITAPDFETLAYAVAYAHAQDNICQTADHLVTVRGERSRHFGPKAMGNLGLRALPNDVIDLFIASHMDDAALERAWGSASADARSMVRGYVAGYNRYLQDHAGQLPAACKGQPWVRPMTEAEWRRINEVLVTQAGVTALADAVVGAQPPAARAAAGEPAFDMVDAVESLRDAGLVEPRFGSNAWAFGREVTANGRGLLMGNPHFPWQGVNRFWQVHLTIPGQLDVMGAGIGHTPVVQIGFNRDVAWSHTVSTGKRFTLHELRLVPGDPTSYLLDGQPEKMSSRTVAGRTLWRSRFGPVVVNPRAGLNWTAETAYALQDANAGNVRGLDAWLAFNRARSVGDMRQAQRGLGIPWVNTIAADRHGNAYYADVSVVPDVDAAKIAACKPGPRAAALFASPAGLLVLDGSRSACDWQRDGSSPVPGLTPLERMPVAVRSDWVHNSNDSFHYTHPQQKFEGISPLVGDAVMRRPRTRAGLLEIPEMLARGKVTPETVQRQLFANRNHVAEAVLPDLLAACPAAPTPEAQAGCGALAGFGKVNDLGARGAHLFREFWRVGSTIPGVWRLPFDPGRPAATPVGLKLDDTAVAAKVWDALGAAVKKVREAGFALDAPLGEVQRAATSSTPIGLHGGDEIEGVLNNLGDRRAPGIGRNGIMVDYGTSYVQTVTFDERGPVAHALLTYGQSTNPESPHATDQTRLFSRKEWPRLPFHREEVTAARLGAPLVLTRP